MPLCTTVFRACRAAIPRPRPPQVQRVRHVAPGSVLRPAACRGRTRQAAGVGPAASTANRAAGRGSSRGWYAPRRSPGPSAWATRLGMKNPSRPCGRASCRPGRLASRACLVDPPAPPASAVPRRGGWAGTSRGRVPDGPGAVRAERRTGSDGPFGPGVKAGPRDRRPTGEGLTGRRAGPRRRRMLTGERSGGIPCTTATSTRPAGSAAVPRHGCRARPGSVTVRPPATSAPTPGRPDGRSVRAEAGGPGEPKGRTDLAGALAVVSLGGSLGVVLPATALPAT